MDKKSIKGSLDHGIETGTSSHPQHVNGSTQAAKPLVKKAAHDEDISSPKKAPTNSDADKQKPESAGIGAMYLWAMLENKTREDNSNVSSGIDFEALLKKGNLDQGDVFNADSSDARVRDMEIAEYTDQETGERRYYTGEALTKFRATHRELPLGPDNFRMKSIGQVQTEMVSAVAKAAAITGVPAGLIGAMAGKESTFGKGQVSSSGAEGLFQQTDGYLVANYVNNKKQSAFIAQHVPEAAQFFADGQISKNEARKLAWNPEAAALMTALRAKDLAQTKGFDLNNRNTWGFVYTEHNAGRGSLNKLLNGGMTDGWIQNLNPSMYKGASSASDVLAIADRDMKLWGNRFEKLTTQLGMSAPSSDVQATVSVPHVRSSALVETREAAHAVKEAPVVKTAFHAAANATHHVVNKGVEIASSVSNTITSAASDFWSKIKPSVFGA